MPFSPLRGGARTAIDQGGEGRLHPGQKRGDDGAVLLEQVDIFAIQTRPYCREIMAGPGTAQGFGLEPGQHRVDRSAPAAGTEKRGSPQGRQGDDTARVFGNIEQTRQKRTGPGFCQRGATGIVKPDTEPHHLGRNPPGEATVGRNENGRPILRLQCLAQQERADPGFADRVGRLDQRQAVDCPLEKVIAQPLAQLAETGHPLIRRAGRPQGFGDNAAAYFRVTVFRSARPGPDIPPVEPGAGDKIAHRPLRVSVVDPVPGPVIGIPVKARQDDRPLGQAGDHLHEVARGRDGAGRANGQHGMIGRGVGPAFDQLAQDQ